MSEQRRHLWQSALLPLASALLLCLPAAAQKWSTDSLLVVEGRLPDSVHLLPYLRYWVDTTGEADAGEALRKGNLFLPADRAESWVPPRRFMDMSVWTRFSVRNNTRDTLRWCLLHREFIGYTIKKTAIFQIADLRRDTAPQADAAGRHLLRLPLQVLPGATVTVLAREQHSIMALDSLCLGRYVLVSPEKDKAIWQAYLDQRRNRFYLASFYMGALALILGVALIQFLLVRERLYLFYALYVGTMLLSEWAYFESEHYAATFIVPCPLVYTGVLEMVLIYLGFLTYLPVTRLFLKSSGYSPVLQRKIWNAMWWIIVLFAINLMLLFWEGDYVFSLFNYAMRLAFDIMGVWLIIWLFRIGRRITTLVGIGAVGLLVGLAASFWAWALSPWPASPPDVLHDPVTWTVLAVLWDLVFFTAALLSERFREMRNSLVESERALNAQLRADNDLLRRLAEAEMQALRVQMNPHFIFNGLTAVETMVLRGENTAASGYLVQFAALLRRVLENSRKPLIPLSDELDTLRRYVALEQMRFPGLFDFRLTVDARIAADEVLVPPTILQPYVENAIRHGLMPSKRADARLRVYVREEVEPGFIQIQIEDNGVGRTTDTVQKPHRESLGMKITADRIAYAAGSLSPENTVTVTDLTDPNGRPTGTRVFIRMAVIMD